MYFVALLLAVIAVYRLQQRIFSQKVLEKLTYGARIDTDEVFAGDDFYLYEELTSRKWLPVPYAKVDTLLPEGLKFRLTERTAGGTRDRLAQNVQSVFVIHPHGCIRRRWRVNCRKRGIYHVGRALLVSNDLLGLHPVSAEFSEGDTPRSTVTVLPRAVDLSECFTSSNFQSGDVLAVRSLLSDPLLRAGMREYAPGDPMRAVNWKSSAVHGRLMVNVEEFTRRRHFTMLLNMNSRIIEHREGVPCDPAAVERGITVCASVFERVCPEHVSVRLVINTPSSGALAELGGKPEDETGERLVFTRPYEGRGDVLEALRLLAAIPLEISCPPENMFDHLLAEPWYYCGDGNLLVVSAYIDERMVDFARAMARRGIAVVFYITTTGNDAAVLPDDIEAFYQTCF